MEKNNELIETKHPHKSKGVKIEREAYAAAADLILRQIKHDEDATLATLIAEAEKTMKTYPNVAWLVFHVKLDLEAKGFIRLMPSRLKRNAFVLRLTSKANRQKGKPFDYYQ
ncbi:MAG TPA: hypothetical protein VIU12_09635 [Chryseolinea sp.]